MKSQHLSDEAVAACADGVLTGHPRQRAERHIAECAECRSAVRVQREAAFALRAAPAPAVPSALADRLRSVPMTTPLTTLPTVLGPDGSTMLATFAAAASPVAAIAPAPTTSARRADGHAAGDTAGETAGDTAGDAAEHGSRLRHAVKPIVATVAVVALAGSLTAGSIAPEATAPAQTGHGSVAPGTAAGRRDHPGPHGPGASAHVVSHRH